MTALIAWILVLIIGHVFGVCDERKNARRPNGAG